MKKIFIFFSIFCLFSVSSWAQKKAASSRTPKAAMASCQLTETPKLRGFFLGQTVDEISELISNFKNVYKKEQEMGDWFTLSDFSELTKGKEIGLFHIRSEMDVDDTFIDLWLFQDRVYGFKISYTDYDPPTAQSFIKQLAEKTSLPSTGWKKLLTPNIDTPKNRAARVMMTHIEAVLICRGFKVNVHTAYRDSASLTVTDTDAEANIMRLVKEIKQRNKKEEKERLRLEREKRTTFKP